jgi:predicted NBD/HSP70 family sugar kinase
MFMITAVDVGATKTLVAQFDKGLRPIGQSRFETPHSTDEFLRQLTDHLAAYDTIESLTIGVPGIINEEGVVLRCSNLPWKFFALGHHLSNHYNVPVYIQNDAKLAALAEVNHLPTLPHLGLYLTVSTGIGSGIIIDGKLLPAFYNGEAGHMRIYFEGKWQQWQKFASGSALVKHFGKRAEDFTREFEWREVADRLGRGLNCLIPTLMPEVIIFGGGVGNYFEHFDEELYNKISVLEPYIDLPKLIKAHRPNEAVLFGCYYYATHRLPS